jgi:hypothetical protein
VPLVAFGEVSAVFGIASGCEALEGRVDTAGVTAMGIRLTGLSGAIGTSTVGVAGVGTTGGKGDAGGIGDAGDCDTIGAAGMVGGRGEVASRGEGGGCGVSGLFPASGPNGPAILHKFNTSSKLILALRRSFSLI